MPVGFATANLKGVFDGFDRRATFQDIIERKVPSGVLFFEITKFSFYYVFYISLFTRSLLRWIRPEVNPKNHQIHWV